MPSAPGSVTIAELLARYQVILLDAYGVLVNGTSALPGAADLLAAITAHDRRQGVRVDLLPRARRTLIDAG